MDMKRNFNFSCKLQFQRLNTHYVSYALSAIDSFGKFIFQLNTSTRRAFHSFLNDNNNNNESVT